MQVLVTGSSGFIGKHLVRLLHQNTKYCVHTTSRTRLPSKVKDTYKGHFIHVPIGNDSMVHYDELNNHFTADLSDIDSVRAIFRKIQPDVVCHLAANPKGNAGGSKVIDDNIKATYNILDCCPTNCRFIFASTVVVYGDATPLSLRHTETHTPHPTSLYAASKLASEALIQTYTNQGKVRGISLRLCATVGPGLTHGIIYDFVNKIRSDSTQLEVLGARPGSVKPFIHVNDVCAGFELMINRQNIAPCYNLCLEDELSVEQIAHIVLKTTNSSKPIKWLGEKSTWVGDNKIIKASNSFMKLTGWKPQYTAEQAIIETARSYRESFV